MTKKTEKQQQSVMEGPAAYAPHDKDEQKARTLTNGKKGENLSKEEKRDKMHRDHGVPPQRRS
jgi:hypothetical protein